MAERIVAAVFPADMETIHAGYWKTSSRAAIDGSSSNAQGNLGRILLNCVTHGRWHEMSNGLSSLEHIQQRNK
jgi:hypothetical protein